MKNNTLIDVLEKYGYDDIWERVEAYIRNETHMLDCCIWNRSIQHGIGLLNIKLLNSFNTHIDDSVIRSDVIVTCTIEYQENRRGDKKEYEQWFLVSVVLMIFDERVEIKIVDVQTYYKKQYDCIQNKLTNTFVPILSKADFDIEAEKFLSKYCPQALEEPMPVPVRDIAKRMNLKIKEGMQFNAKPPIFGAIAFFDCKANLRDRYGVMKQYNIPKGSIIIDNRLSFWSIGCVNYTIAHELYHWHRHRIYAQIQRLLNGKDSLKSLNRCNTTPARHTMFLGSYSDVDWMEWQANSIAPKILMPKQMFERKLTELLNSAEYTTCTMERKSDILNSIITELSELFQVSRQATIIRMHELGIEDVEQVYNSRYKSEPCYEIDFTSYIVEYRCNEKFKKLIDSGDFLYIDNHCVINNDKYLLEESLGRVTLSEYALTNKSECCLQFYERIILNRKRLDVISAIFYRGQQQAYTKAIELIDYIGNDGLIDSAAKKAKARLETAKAYDCRLNDAIVSDFGKSINNLIDIFAEEMNFDQHKIVAEIEEMTLLNKKTISDMRLNKTKPTKRTILSFCIGMSMGYNETVKLLKNAGHSLGFSDDDYFYSIILMQYRGKDIDTINEILETCGVKKLGSK